MAKLVFLPPGKVNETLRQLALGIVTESPQAALVFCKAKLTCKYVAEDLSADRQAWSG